MKFNLITRSVAFSLSLYLSQIGLAHAFGPAKPAAPDPQIDQPTAAQLECRKAIPKTPKRIVIGFEGLNGYDAQKYQELKTGPRPSIVHQTKAPSSGAMLVGMIGQGVVQIDDTVWFYYDESTIQDTGLSEPLRCAYELAKQPYSDGHGGTLYSTVSVMGFSYGGHATYQLVNQLKTYGITTNLAVTADPRSKWLSGVTFNMPAFVGRWFNFYQRNNPALPGQNVNGADVDQPLTSKGYDHQEMPGSDEVTRAVREQLGQLTTCRGSLNENEFPSINNCPR